MGKLKYKSACMSLRPGQLHRMTQKIKDFNPNTEKQREIKEQKDVDMTTLSITDLSNLAGYQGLNTKK